MHASIMNMNKVYSTSKLSTNPIMSMLLVLYLCVSLACALSSVHGDLHEGRGVPLPRAFAKPPNIASDLDCALKKLAMDYAKELTTTVSMYT